MLAYIDDYATYFIPNLNGVNKLGYSSSIKKILGFGSELIKLRLSNWLNQI